MPPRRRATPAPIDVDDLKSRLELGKIVRVAIARSAQFPQGAVGRVRRIGDPGVDGEEFIQVELSVNGTKDLLPFAPADLTTPTRGGAANDGHASEDTGRPVTPATTTTAPTRSTTTATPRSVARIPAPADTVAGTDSGTAPAASDQSDPALPKPGRHQPVRPRAGTKRRGPAVTISIGTTDADPPQWRIEARIGSKVVLRNGSVPPSRVWELVGMLGDETLSRTVGGVLDEQRQAAQARADALATELARVQAELAELPAPRSTF